MVQGKKGKRYIEVFKTRASLSTSVLATQAPINLSLRHLAFCFFHPIKNKQFNLKLPPPHARYKYLLIKYKNKLWILTMKRTGINILCTGSLNFTYRPPGITAIIFLQEVIKAKSRSWSITVGTERFINTPLYLGAHVKFCQI